MEFVQETIKNVLVVSLRGQIRISTQNECKNYFDELTREHSHSMVVLNMSGVGYINSVGVGILIESFKKFKENSGRLVLCSLVPDIEKLFEVTKLDRYIELYKSEQEALRDLIKP